MFLGFHLLPPHLVLRIFWVEVAAKEMETCFRNGVVIPDMFN
jgi:hypothetical protein